MKQRLALPLAVLMISATAAVAQGPSIYVFDVLKRPTYSKSYDRMFRGERNVPSWFGTAKRATEGTTDAGTIEKVGGVEEELYTFCEQHNCAGHSFAVLFSSSGERAVGASNIGGTHRFFGNPTDREQYVLTRASSQ